MTLREWLRGKDFQHPPPVETDLVDAAPELVFIPGTGSLDPRSPTWAYVRNWATEALQKAREKNDSINNDLTKTSAIRGEIKILKELLNLPNPKKGLLLED